MADQEDFSQLPLAEQFQHKNWKARKVGYETAAKEFKTCQPTDPIVREFLDGQLWKGAVSDANVAAQQEALGAYNAFLDAAGTDGARKTRQSTVAGVVEKGLTGRPAAKQAATETLLLLIELDKSDPIIEELLPFLSHKQPKLIVATLSALTAIFHAYGCKVVEPKPVIKQLPKIYGHADKNVRAEGQNLTTELYRWLREAMKPLFWSELKDVQQKDLEKLFEPVKAEPTPKQERLLRSQQAAREEAPAALVDGDDGVDDEEAAIDLEPEFEAVDVFAKIPKDFDDRLASAKWKDRKDALDELFAAVNVPAMQDGPFDNIIRGCAKSMKDANIAVVAVAANCVEAIAKGLKKSFGKYRSVILEPMLERIKEKKASVTDAIGAACDAVFATGSLADIEPQVLEAMKNKNPQVKEHSAKFLSRSLRTTREAPSVEQTKVLAEASKKLLAESAPALRDVGAEILGVLWKIMGDRNMLAHLEGLDDIRKNKIKEFSDAAEVKAKWKLKVAAAPAPKAAPPAAGKRPVAKKPAAPSTIKKAAPRSASPSPMEEAPLAARPTSRPGIKPAGSLRPPGAGLKPPTGLVKPGSALKPPSGLNSPKAEAPASKSGLPGRGLAGRPLGKPVSAAAPPSPTPQRSEPSSMLSAGERQELASLREMVDSLQQQNSDLRNDKMRLTSQVHELQNQNAQMIEDHTRDVLQIKAKETQLVRARNDAETAEERAVSLAKEVDRLKREMGRLGRTASQEEGVSNGDGALSSGNKPAYGSTARSYTQRSLHNDDEGKENFPDGVNSSSKLSGFSAQQRSSSRPLSGTALSSGRATPASGDAGDRDGTYGRAMSGDSGMESWKRAAEVTQNLKARIEMMKARQNVASRGGQ